MKKKIYHLFLFIGILLSFSASFHPLKISASLIDYNPENNKLKVECKVFIDDFLKSINKDIDINNLKEQDKLAIQEYFNKFYSIKLNNIEIPLTYKNSDVNMDFNILTVQFNESELKIKKRDKLEIVNQLLFNEFGFLQSNRMELRFPPFFSSYYVECNKVKDNFTHTFK